MTERRTAIRWIVQTSLNLRYMVVAASVGLMVLGVVSPPEMRVDVFPEFAPPRVVIQTACGPVHLGRRGAGDGAARAGAERPARSGRHAFALCAPAVLDRAAVLARHRSAPGPPAGAGEAGHRLAQSPDRAAPPIILAPVSATGRAMQIGAEAALLIEMSMSAYWNIRARLLQVPGVANVAIWNERLQMMTVQVETPKLAEHDHPRPGDGDHRGRRRLGTAAVLLRQRHRHGGAFSSHRTSGCPSATSCRSSPPPTWPRYRSRASRARPRPRDVAVVAEEHQPLIGDAVVDSEPDPARGREARPGRTRWS